MQRILCYGDSNTWGFEPGVRSRYSHTERWTGVLSQLLGGKYTVIEEGLNGRTTVWDDPIEPHRNGKTYLPPCLLSHKPLDLVIIMLGTNDCKFRYSATAYDIACGAGVLADIVKKSETGRNNGAPGVLLIAPAPITKLSGYKEVFQDGKEKSLQLARFYKQIAEDKNCYFMDASQYIHSSDIDGLHLEKEEHAKLGQAVYEFIQSTLAAE